MQPVTCYRVASRFDRQASTYRCCCRACHVKSGAWCIAAFELLYAVGVSGYAWLLFLLVHEPDSASWVVMVIVHLAVPACMLLAIPLLLGGLRANRPTLTLCHVVVQFFQMLACVAWIVLMTLAIARQDGICMELLGQSATTADNNQNPSELPKLTAADDRTRVILAIIEPLRQEFPDNVVLVFASVHLACASLCLVLQAWWICVVLRLYRYLRDRRSYIQKAQQYPGYAMIDRTYTVRK